MWELQPLELLYGCNYQWWKHYWSKTLAGLPAEKWTANKQAADEFGINWIAEENAPGLSQDAGLIHHGHGGGYSLLNLAYLHGATRILLLGYDMQYAPDYDGRARFPGSSPRHYFGEYPTPLLHWPTARVNNGVHTELVELYESVARQGLVEIINCNPRSAVRCFPFADIEKL